MIEQESVIQQTLARLNEDIESIVLIRWEEERKEEE